MPSARQRRDTLLGLILRHLPQDAWPEATRAWELAIENGATCDADAFMCLVREFLNTWGAIRS